MKLILVIVNSDDSGRLMEILAKKKVPVTKLASTGGFLRTGNSTLLIGTDEDKVDGIIETIKDVCKSRTQTISAPGFGLSAGINLPMEVTVGGATVFVLDVDRYEKV